MKRISEVMWREPSAEQAATVEAVLKQARAWEIGTMSLGDIHRLSGGDRDRFDAMRFTKPGTPERELIKSLLDALATLEPDVIQTEHGAVLRSDFFAERVLISTDWQGKRCYVWPYCVIEGESLYPPFDQPPGSPERERVWADIKARCDAAAAKRKAAKKRGGHG